jgi:superfamily II DNA or RNA helicase
MQVYLNLSSQEDYHKFLRIKALPSYHFSGRTAWFPDEYAERVTGIAAPKTKERRYVPYKGLFDYQAGISRLSIRKRKFGVFAAPGWGKTFIQWEFARHAAAVVPKSKAVLMIAPLMVVEQTLDDIKRFYGKCEAVQIRANSLNDWIVSGKERIGITNWDALTDETPQGRIAALVPDETSCMASHYGAWGTNLIRIGRGVDWKLCSTGTPAPNDRIEYANHAVFLDAFPTINSFLSRFFVNRGKTSERWEMKAHSLRPFYRALSHWCIFMSNPAVYGWKDNTTTIPPIHVHIHDVDLTEEQQDMIRFYTGNLFACKVGGITQRSKLSQIAKGNVNGNDIESLKPAYIRELVGTWPEESTIIWCRFNPEQERLAREFPGCASIQGSTEYEERKVLINEFKAGKRKVLISKPEVLGYGLNLQVATRQVFSSCEDSYLKYQQAVKRSNRVGSTRPLNVHLVVTEAERPMMENVLRKADRVQGDDEEQEKLFLECGYDGGY